MSSEVDPGTRRRLLLAREAARLTQKVAAVEIGVTRHKLGRWESGESSPSLEEFTRLCIVYGVTPSYILLGADIRSVIGRAMKAASSATSAS